METNGIKMSADTNLSFSDKKKEERDILAEYLLQHVPESEKTIRVLRRMAPYTGMQTAGKIVNEDTLEDMLSVLRAHSPRYDRDDCLVMSEKGKLIFIGVTRIDGCHHGVFFITADIRALFGAPWAEDVMASESVSPEKISLSQIPPQAVEDANYVYPQMFGADSCLVSHGAVHSSIFSEFNTALLDTYREHPNPYPGFVVHLDLEYKNIGKPSECGIDMLLVMFSPEMGRFDEYTSSLWAKLDTVVREYEQKSDQIRNAPTPTTWEKVKRFLRLK